MIENYELTLSEYWRIIRKRKEVVAIVFVLVMISTFIFTKLQTPIYESTLELKIERHQPILTSKDSEQATNNDGPSLATDMRLITSLPLLYKVAEKMEVLPTNQDERDKKLHSLALSYRDLVSVDQIQNTNILVIRARSSEPQKSALMATAIADVYAIENIKGRKKQTESLIDYLDQQQNEYQRQLADLEAKLQKFKQNEKVFEVTPKVKETLDRLTIQGTFEFEGEMLKIDTELKAMQEEDATREVQSIFNKMTNEDLSNNYIFIGLKRRLLELEFERFLLLIDYTEKHPSVIAQDKIVSDVKMKIVNMLRSNSHEAFTPQMENDLAVAIKKLFLETRKEVLYRIVNKFYGDSGSLSSNQTEYVGLKRNIDLFIKQFLLLQLGKQQLRNLKKPDIHLKPLLLLLVIQNMNQLVWKLTC